MTPCRKSWLRDLCPSQPVGLWQNPVFLAATGRRRRKQDAARFMSTFVLSPTRRSVGFKLRLGG